MELQGRDLRVNMRGEDVRLLQSELLALGYGIPEDEVSEMRFGGRTGRAVRDFQERHGLEVTTVVDETTAAAINAEVDAGKAHTFIVEGKVFSRSRAGVGGLGIQIVDKNVGSDMNVGDVVTTNSEGAYRSEFIVIDLQERGKERPDLQACAFRDQSFLGASEVRYNASNHETLNIVLEGKADSMLASEYKTLTDTLAVYYKGSLGELKETNEGDAHPRKDITYLANKTGWDARAVALAALAKQFSDRTTNSDGNPGIEPAFFYALFRAGVPANEDALYQTAAKDAAGIWRQGIEQGVIPAELKDRVPQSMERFQSLAAERALERSAMVGVSSLKEMLDLSLGDDSAQHRKFAELQVRHRTDWTKFWDGVRDEFGEAAQKRLRLDGQLAYLTLNNAPLIRKLHEGAGPTGITEALELVKSGYYRADSWPELIDDDAIPREIPEENNDKKGNYAELMAAQLRLSFPTAVVAEMVKSGETPLTDGLAGQVHAFLTEHQGKFEIGMQPVQRYLARNNLQASPDVIREITRIQRVYQITPSDGAMNALLKKGVDSAYAVVRYGQEAFIRVFEDELGEEHARLTYVKAQEVHNTVLNVATSYLISRTAPGLGVHSPAQYVDPAPKAEHASDVIAYSTLEDLFEEMDYCDCEHCRSILSPAAYLVNLLQFIDPEPAAWQKDLDDWKNEHGGAPYPFSDPTAWDDAGNPTDTEITPLQVLLSRRPDIQHLPLTCENTNTPLPYIDLVNEVLEYYVTNGLSLADTDPDPNINTEYIGHNTDGSVKPEELLASPQFVHDAAYTTLAGVRFPSLLPFHQRLENLRRNFDRFKTPLPSVMEALRKNDNLERASVSDYGWRDILMEELQFSRTEYDLLIARALTNGNTDVPLTVKQLYGFDPATPENEVLFGNWTIGGEDKPFGLSYVKPFARRVGVSYEEIIDILRTRFINSNSTLIPKLERLNVSFSTLKDLKDGTITDSEFSAMLPPGLDPSQYGGNIPAWVKDDDNYARIMGLIVVANPTDEPDLCSLDKFEFRYSNPDNNTNQVSAFDFIRLLRFIRLWKKLGWTIEQTDKAITALYPVDQVPNDPDGAVNLEKLDAGFLTLLPRLGVIKRVMDALKLRPQKDVLPLLACFAPIDTHGAASLYRQMFASEALKQDPAFADDGYGNFLPGNEEILDHSDALRAAFLLTDSEIFQIAADLDFDASTPLTVEKISAVFRRGWLARKLKLSVCEFLLLIHHTGIDPFLAPDPPDAAAVAPREQAPILRFLELIDRMRAVSLKPEQALYLIWNEDISGRSAPHDDEIFSLSRTLRADLAAIEKAFAIADDPDGSIASARMAQVYGIEATDLFFGLLDNTFVTEVPYSHGQATLEQFILDAAPGRVSYDHFRKQLAFAGFMTTESRDALKVGVPLEFENAVDKLYEENQKVIEPFFDRYPELLPLHDVYVASADPVEEKRSTLLANFLPELIRRRKRQQVLQVISAAAKGDVGLASAVLDDVTVLHAAGNNTRPALDDLMALETAGLSVQFFFADTAGGNPDLPPHDAEANLDYSATGTKKLPLNGNNPANAISGIWRGYLEAPENGFYNLRIETDAGATVTLAINGATVALAQSDKVWSNDAPIELRSGTLYPIVLTVEKVKDALKVRWQGRLAVDPSVPTIGGGWEVIPPRYLYSATLTDHLRTAYVRFLKTVSLATNLKLTSAETSYLVARADYHIDGQGWLNSLPVAGKPDNVMSVELLKAFTALLDFARINGDLAPKDERLLSVIKDPPEATQNPDSLLFTLTRWESNSLNALLKRFDNVIGDLAHLENFRRVYDAYAFVKQLRVLAAALISAATNEPDANTVRDFQAVLRARYDETQWLNVLRPINDEMRGLQRDALVAYILHQMRSDQDSSHIDTPEKLFEYFLMDVQMDACMQTSRIRHALSSVQLFIERCLMNLEPRVAPSTINAKQWEWMKRYRVWEANRKIFLWPENWLEPELRDDQSPFFKETMSELLQSDITEERAAIALQNYLAKLEEVAKLEPCGIHYVESEPRTSNDIAHVVARTAGGSRKYFYRRYEYGYWTPWVPIKLDIEDNPVLPVIWKGRLFLFWLKILKEPASTGPSVPNVDNLADVNPADVIPSEAPPLTVKAILCWSEFFNGKWQPTKTSDIGDPAFLTTLAQNNFDRSRLLMSVSVEVPYLGIRINTITNGGTQFFLYNTHSAPQWGNGPSYKLEEPRQLNSGGITFKIEYGDGNEPNGNLERSVLKSSMTDRAIQPRHYLRNVRGTPFFYEDSRHVFYVTTDTELVPVYAWNDFGVASASETAVAEIPPLVLEEAPYIPRKPKPDPVLNTTMDGTGLIQRLMTEDAHINKAIGTMGTIDYGNVTIGIGGSLRKL